MTTVYGRSVSGLGAVSGKGKQGGGCNQIVLLGGLPAVETHSTTKQVSLSPIARK